MGPDTVDAIALPRRVRLRPSPVGLAFPRMKRLPARRIVRGAREDGAGLGGDRPTLVSEIFPMTKERS
jgi:hypothetical protein